MLERNLGSMDFLTYHQVMSNEESFIYRYCIATLLNRATLDSILDQSDLAKIKDSHPWIVAKRVTESANSNNQACPLLIGSLDENSEKSNSGKFKLKRTISVGSLDSGTLKKSNSSNSLSKARKQTKKNMRRKRDNLIFMNGKPEKEFSRTPTPPMFQELEKMFKSKKN